MFNKIRETAIHGIVYGLGQTLTSAVGFLLIPLYTQHLSASEYGLNALLTTTSLLMSAFWGLGLNSALFKSYYNYETERDRKIVVSTTFYTLLLSALALAIIGFSGASGWSTLIFGEIGFERYCMFTFWTTGLNLLQAVPFAVYRARQLSKRYTLFNGLFLLLRLGFIIFWVAYKQYGVWGIVLGNFLASLLSTIVMTITISDSIVWGYSFSEAKKLLRFGFPLVFVNLAGILLNSSDRYFLRVYSTLDQVGIYNLGYQFGMLIQIVFTQPLGLIWPTMLFSVAKKEYATRFYSRMLTYASLVSVFVWLGVALLSEEVIMLIAQPNYWPAYEVVPLISFSYVFDGLRIILIVGILLAGRTEFAAMVSILAAIVNLVLNAVLIPVYGIMGAAYATILSFILLCVSGYLVAKRFYFVPYEWWRLLKIIIIGGGLYWVGSLIATTNAMVNLLFKVGCVIIFPFVLYLLRFYSEEEVSKARFVIISRLTAWRDASISKGAKK